MNLIFYDYAAILFSCLVCVCALLCFGVEFQRSVSLDPIFAVPAWLAPLKSPRFFEERPEIGRAECLLSTGYTFRNRSSVSAGFTVLTTVQGITSGPTGLQVRFMRVWVCDCERGEIENVQ